MFAGMSASKRERVDDEVKWAVSVQPRIVTTLELGNLGTSNFPQSSSLNILQTCFCPF